jgi:hypothetical protein
MWTRLPAFAHRSRCTLLMLTTGVGTATSLSSQAALVPEAVAGCYRLTDGAHMTPLASPFFGSVIRLDTQVTRRFRERIHGDSGRYPMVTLARRSRALTFDTLMNVATWSLRRRDSLKLVRSDGFTGESVTLSPDSAGFHGQMWYFTDVIDPNRPPRKRAVVLRRVACPGATAGRRMGQ